MKIHPFAEIFPEMDAESFAALVDDIRANGQRDAILVTSDSQIIDGRHRWRACSEIGISPLVETVYDDTDLLALVISRNMRRRDLTPSQRAVIMLELDQIHRNVAVSKQVESGGKRRNLQNNEGGEKLPTLARYCAKVGEIPQLGGESDNRDVHVRQHCAKVERGPKSSAVTAKAAMVGRRTVESARYVAEKAPEALGAIRRGEVSVSAVERKIRQQAAKDEESGVSKDAVGQEIPAKLRDAFDGADVLADLKRRIEAIRREVIALADKPYGAAFRPETIQRAEAKLQEVAAMMRIYAPYAVVPAGKTGHDVYKRGWLTKAEWEAMPK